MANHAPVDIVGALRARGVELKRKGAEWAGPCWKCGGRDRFHVRGGEQVAAVSGCRGCGVEHGETVRELFGSGAGEWDCEWRCDGPDGSRVHQRRGDGPAKVIRWAPGDLGAKRLVYRTGDRDSAVALMVEGEKAADAAARLCPDWRIIGTCQGAPTCPDADVLTWALDGVRSVWLWPDNDDTGREQMRRIAGCLDGPTVRTIDPAALGLTAKGADVADWRPGDDVDVLDALTGAASRPEADPDPDEIDLDTLAPLLRSCSIVEEPVDWLWPGRIARGTLFAVSGAPDAGKTLMCAALASAESSGRALPGADPREPGRVVWIGGPDEDPHQQTVARLRVAGADGDRVRVFQSNGETVEIAGICEAVRKWKPTLVVIDSHVSWFREANDGPKVRAELRTATARLLHDGATVGVITHWRKSSVEAGPDHMRTAGSNQGIIGAVRAALEVEKSPGEDAGVLRTTKHNAGPQPEDVRYRIESHGSTGVLVWDGTAPHTPGGAGAGPSDDKLLDAVDECGELATKNRVCCALFGDEKGKPRASKARCQAAKERLDVLVASGRLVRDKATISGQSRDVYRRPPEANHSAHSAAFGADPPNTPPAHSAHSAPLYVPGPNAEATDTTPLASSTPNAPPNAPDPLAKGLAYPLVAALDWSSERPRDHVLSSLCRIIAADPDPPPNALPRLRAAWRESSEAGRSRARRLLDGALDTLGRARETGQPITTVPEAAQWRDVPMVAMLEELLDDDRWRPLHAAPTGGES